MTLPEGPGFSTRQVHIGKTAPDAAPRALPIAFSAGFTFASFDDAAAHFGAGDGFGYTRVGNPTTTAVEERIAALESGAGAVLLASGQAAAAVVLLGLVPSGSHVVSSTHIYEGTRGLLVDVLSNAGVSVDFVDDVNDPDAWRRAIRPETRALFAESISNARNVVLDIAAVAAVADESAVPLIVDNTFATPYLVRPLEHGAAIVIHSASKFLAGHGTALGGVIIDDGRFDGARAGALFPRLTAQTRSGGPSLWQQYGGLARIAYLRDVIATRLGPTVSPFNAFFIAQGIETLSLRVARQSANALAIAEWLEARPEIVRVDYAGLASHPQHTEALRYLDGGFGSVFTVTLHGGLPSARALIERVRYITHMSHLGDVRSLVLHPATTSHVLRTPEEQAALGVHPGTIRLSIGIEDPADLIADLENALVAASEASAAERELAR